jgi:hypothetical protein
MRFIAEVYSFVIGFIAYSLIALFNTEWMVRRFNFIALYFRKLMVTLDLQAIQALSPDKRYAYLLKSVVHNQEIWILTDEHGCVMLNTEDEDCVPVWPSEAFAQQWANGDWETCVAKSITLKVWQQRWTHGLTDDDVELVAFPLTEDDGYIVSAQEFEEDLSKSA